MAGRVFKPDYFHGKPEEDAEAWLAHFIKVAVANEWDADASYRMVPVFLKGAAERWWNRTRTTAWTNDVNDNTVIGFQELFLAYFVGENKRAKWQDQFENIRQGKKSIEEYNEEFIQKLKKADPDGTIPAAINIRKYIKSIKPEIAQAVYTEAPTSLEEAMEIAEKIQRGRDLIKGSSEAYLAEIEDL